MDTWQPIPFSWVWLQKRDTGPVAAVWRLVVIAIIVESIQC